MATQQLSCPECDAAFKITAFAGKKAVRCPECGEKFTARAEDEVDEPKPKKKSAKDSHAGLNIKKPAGSKALLWVGVIGGGALVLIGGILLIVAVSYAVTRPPAEQVAQQPPPPAPPPPIFFPPPNDGGFKPGPGPGNPPIDPQPGDDLPRIQLPNIPQLPLPQLLPNTDKPFLVTDPGGHTAAVRSAFFLPGDDLVATVSADKSVRIWEVSTGDTLHTFRLPTGAGDEGALAAGAASPDGRWLAVGGINVGGTKHGFVVYLISLQTGQVARVMRGHLGSIRAIAFTPNGRYLASAGFDGTVLLHDPRTGEIVRVFRGHRGPIMQMAISPNNQLLATTSRDRTAIIWNIADGKPVQVLNNFADEVLSIAFNPVERGFATGCVDGTIQLWRLDGQRIANFKIDEKIKRQPVVIAYSPDARELLYGGVSFSGDVGLIDLAGQRQRFYFNKHSNTVFDARFSHDGKLAITTGGDRHETIVWRVKDGAILQKLQGTGNTVWAVGWRRDGKAIGWHNINDKRAKLQNAFHWEDLYLGPPPDDQVYTRFTTDLGNWSLRQPNFFVVDILQDGRPVNQFKSPIQGDRIYSWSLLPGNRAVIGTGFALFLIDVNTGRIVRNFRGHNGIVVTLSPSPDGRHFLTGSTDQTMALWDLNSDEPLLSMFVADREWVAWTPQGYYAASPYGERLMGWLINNGIDQLASYYPAARFHASLYQPALIKYLFQEKNFAKALELARKENPAPIGGVTLSQVLPPDVAIVSPATRTQVVKQAELEIKAKAKSTGNYPVTALRILVDGRPYRGAKSFKKIANPKLGEVEAAWTIDLLPGKHSVAVIAESAVSKGISSVVEVTREGAAKDELPNLFIVAAGISEYPPQMRLNYAHKDAIVLEKTFKEHTAGVFKNVETRLLTDKNATRKQIVESMDWLQKKMTSKDVAIVFFAGHGSRDPRGQFHFIPVDCDLRRMDETCISGDFLKGRLANLPGRVVVMLDACHSGSAAAAPKKALADDLMRELVSEDYGVVVMCSSQAREYSLESPVVKHGFFTMGVVEALTGKADLNQDKYIYIHEVDFYATQRVRQLSRGMQNPTTGRPPHIRSFPLARMP